MFVDRDRILHNLEFAFAQFGRFLWILCKLKSCMAAGKGASVRVVRQKVPVA